MEVKYSKYTNRKNGEKNGCQNVITSYIIFQKFLTLLSI